MFRTMQRIVLMASTVLVSGTAVSRAGIYRTGGDVQVISPPDSVREGDYTSNRHVFLFPERTALVLGNAVTVDTDRPGFYNQWDDLSSRVISAGTEINSYFLHADQTRLFGSSFTGWFEFDPDEQIVGVIVRWNSLDATDSLGAPGTAYPQGLSDREWDLQQITGGDDFTISSNLRRIDFNASLWAGVDQMRILTVVPEPASLALVGFGGLVLARRRA